MSGGDGDNWMLIGDEAALPFIQMRLRAMATSTRVVVLAEVARREDQLIFDTPAQVSVHWVHSRATFGPRTLNDTLRGMFLPQDGLRVWVACEAREARRVCAQLIDDHGVSAHRIEASGYGRIRAASVWRDRAQMLEHFPKSVAHFSD